MNNFHERIKQAEWEREVSEAATIIYDVIGCTPPKWPRRNRWAEFKEWLFRYE